MCSFEIAILEVLIKDLVPSWRLRALTLASVYNLLFTQSFHQEGHCFWTL